MTRLALLLPYALCRLLARGFLALGNWAATGAEWCSRKARRT